MTAKSTDQLIRDKAEELIDEHELYPSNRDAAVERLTQHIAQTLISIATINLTRSSIHDVTFDPDDDDE